MVNLLKINESDVYKLTYIYTRVEKLFGDIRGKYYKLQINKKEKYLHIYGNCFTVFTFLTEQTLDYEQFIVDENNNITFMDTNNYKIENNDGQLTYYLKNGQITEALSIVKRSYGVDNDGYDSLIVYGQYDLDEDKMAVLSYPYMYRENIRIYPQHIKYPEYISYKAFKKLRAKISLSAVNVDYTQDSRLFTQATIREFGVKKVLEKGAVALQKESKIIRYCKDLSTLLNLFPYCKSYKLEEVKEFLELRGFKSEIPDDLIKIFNQEDENVTTYIQTFNEIIKTLKDNEEKIKVKTLKI